ncbi:YadA-like family protein [Paenalcaligenes sp. Me131]|uniref:YadA-like family protein n=1 Tax=Paenalcaligenes sp. Me131 TaxID=3392636 RepID=UPI003D280837
MSTAWAAVDIPQGENVINFTAPDGTIKFVDGGSIVGLSNLTISGALNADQITVGGESVATLAQLNSTSADVQTNAGKIGVLEGLVAGNKDDLDDHAVKIADNQTKITTHDTRITNNATAITAQGTRIETAEEELDTINNRLTALGVDETNPGVKYFRANSELPDAEANGEESIAIGPDSKAEGDRSIAAGQGALADAESAIALGDGARVASADSRPKPEAAIAIGKDSQSSGLASVAVGREAAAGGNNALALGTQAQASGANGIALGLGAQADAENNISIGNGAGRATGNHLPGDRSHNIAIGQASGQNVKGQFNVALGDGTGNGVNGSDNVALGHSAGLNLVGDANVSLGKNANQGRESNRAIGIGESSGADTEGVAIGYKAIAGNTGVAVGRQTTALGTGTAIGPNAHADSNFVALGLNSHATQSDVSGLGRFTNKGFTGSAVSVGSSQAGSEFTRRIVNVEDGANDTDAVNVRQLQSAVDQVTLGATVDYEKLAEKVGEDWGQQIEDSKARYFSVNDGGVDKGNKDNNGAAATAVDSVAIGPDATAKEKDSVAIGHMAGAEGASAVVMGHNIKGLGLNSTTIGNSQSEARDESGVAIGTHVVSRDKNSIVIGRDSYTDRQANGPSVENSIVIGTESSSTAVEGIVIGKNSVVNAARGIAQGSHAEATANDAMAFGTRSQATAGNSQASGTDAKAFAARSIAIGTNARSGQANPDVENQDKNRDSIALGTDSVAEFNSSIAVGREAQATADYAQAQGKGAHAFGEASIAQGRDALALERQAIALGDGSRSTANRAVAIGQGARAGNARSVALGDGAETAGAVGTSNASLNGLTYGNFAGDRPIATVSVGTEQEKRTVTNVAAGRISASSTDAINGSQLYATNSVLGNVANTTKNILGGNASLAPNGNLSMSNIGDTGENTVHDAIKYAAQGWHVSANGAATANVKPGGSVDFSNDDENIIVTRTGTDLAFNLADDLTVGKSITVGDTVVKGDSITTNSLTVQGETRLGDNFVVNNTGDVIYKGNEVATQADGLSFAGNTGNTIAKTLGDDTPLTISGELAGGEASTGANLRVDSDGNKLSLVMAQNLTDLNSITINNGGPVINVDGINMGGKKITNLDAGTDDTDAVNVSQLKEVSDVANAGWNVSANGQAAENVKPGASVDFSNDDGNITVTRTDTDLAFNLADDLTVGKSITINNGGPVINGDGINMNSKKITNLAAGTEDTDAVNVSQLKDVSEVANAGWNISANGDPAENVKPGGSVDFSNDDGNITVTRTGTDLAFNLNKDIDLGADGSLTTGNTVVNNDGLIVADGAGNKTSTTATGTTVSNTAGEKTTVAAGSITVTDADGNSTAIGSTQVVVGGANQVTINGDTGRISGLTNTTWDPDNYTSGQAATEDQLKRVSDVASAGWNVTDEDGNSANIGPNGKVAFVGDNNVTVEQTGTDDAGQVEVKLNKDIDLGADGSLQTGDTLIDNSGVNVGKDVHLGSTGLVINNGPSMTVDGINAGGMRITHVAAGVNPTDAVNYGQLQPIESFIDLDGKGSFTYNGGQHTSLKDVLDSLHWNVEAPAPGKEDGNTGGSTGPGSPGGGNNSSGDSTPIHNGNTVGFVEGDNIVISKTDKVNDAGQVVGADIKVAVAQDLKVNSITAVNIKADEIQINNGGPIINENGIDMSGKRITNVAAGINETDAVNVGQLQEVAGNLQGQVNHIRNDMHRLDNRLSAGVAAAMATASLPQAYLPGKHMMSMAGGTWRGETGMAIGFSGITDNGKWVYKLSGNATSRGDYGGAVGIGYQW